MFQDNSKLPEGILLINKPLHWTSFDVVQKVRRLLGTKKVGHVGTLDPLATGLLVICVGRYTRLCAHLMASHKEYELDIVLGKSTTTDDGEGDVINEADASHITKEQVHKALESFSGETMQVPPQFSAISFQGKKAYALARRGQAVLLPARLVHISRIELIRFENALVTCQVECSKGTYMRALARDLGICLGTFGFASRIHRTQIGPYHVHEALDGKDLEALDLKGCLIRGSKATRTLPSLEINQTDAQRLRNGQKINLENKSPITEQLYMVFCEDEPIAIANMNHDTLKPLRVF